MTDKTRDDLQHASRENIEFIIESIKSRLKVVNAGAISAESFDTDEYEDLLDVYEYVNKKDHFSTNELDSIIGELGQLRKK